jgi:hypothetical protein
VKPNIINSVEIHPQLSSNGHPVDVVLGGWMLVHCGPKNAKDQLVLLPARGTPQKVSKDMFGACKYLLAVLANNHHAHNIRS